MVDLESQILIFVQRRSILIIDVHIHLKSVDLLQNLSCSSVE